MSIKDVIQSGNSFVYQHTPEPVPFLEQDSPNDLVEKRPLFYSDASPVGFSAVDINAFMHGPVGTPLAGQPLKFGTLSMLSVSTHRDKFPVSSLSSVGPKGYTYGHRTIAGTLAFNTFHRDAFERVLHATEGSWRVDHIHPDELPPFDVLIVMANDAGEMSIARLLGVTLLDSGRTYSLEQITLTETYSYMALDMTPFEPMENTYRKHITAPEPYIGDILPGTHNYSGPTLIPGPIHS